MATTSTSTTSWIVTGLALAVAAGAGGYAVRARGQVRAAEARLADATAQIAAGTKQLADVRRQSVQARFISAVLSAPDLVTIDLAGQKPAPEATGRALWSRRRGLVFVTSGLPPAPEGRTYEIWAFDAGKKAISVGVFAVDEAGRTTSVFNLSADLALPARIAVTLEAAAGGDAPSGVPYLSSRN